MDGEKEGESAEEEREPRRECKSALRARRRRRREITALRSRRGEEIVVGEIAEESTAAQEDREGRSQGKHKLWE